MNQILKTFFLGFALLTSTIANAAIFDTMESVDTLKVIAESRTQKTDRMPAGNATAPTAEESSPANASAASDTSEKN